MNERAEGKQLKSTAATRRVPIHSELIGLGFLDYVAAAKEAGHVRLWPSLRLRKGQPSHAFSAWFSEVARRSVKGVELPDFHSFRHTVNSALATKHGVTEAVVAVIIGHEQKGSEGNKTYLHVDLRHLSKIVELIQYEDFRLPRSYIAGTSPTLLKTRTRRSTRP